MGNDQRKQIQPRCFPAQMLEENPESLGVRKVSNEEIGERPGTRTISEQLRARRWKCLDHVLRMSSEQNPMIALTWAPELRQPQKRTAKRDVARMIKRREAEVAAKDQIPWRRWIGGPILHEERRER